MSGLTDKELQSFIMLTHRLTGITIAANRKSMVESRLSKRMRELNVKTYSEYFDYLTTNESETRLFIDLMTTNETYFYRTPRIWNYIINSFLPEWHKQNPNKIFKAWSAAASSGEEARTIAIICQHFKTLNPTFKYQILGTDISEKMIELCKAGKYNARAVETLKSNRLDLYQQYIIEAGEVFSVKESVVTNIQFKTHNLFKKILVPEKFDLVLIRNVLIYFTQPDQEVVLQNVRSVMHDSSLLIIGESESLMHIKTDFQQLQPLLYQPISSIKKAI